MRGAVSKTPRRLATLLACPRCFAASQPTSPPRYAERWELAQLFIEAEAPALAVSVLRRMIEQAPRQADLWHMLSVAHLMAAELRRGIAAAVSENASSAFRWEASRLSLGTFLPCFMSS